MSDLKRITSEPLVGMALFSNRAKWRSSLSACSSVGKKYLTGSGVVREAILRQWFGNAQNLRLQSSDWTERDFLAIMPFSTGLNGQAPARS
jgi:hypothetical protein